MSFFSWQNQLLAKGLLFMEEKVKLCEGNYSRKPVLEGSWALMFGQMRFCMCGKCTALSGAALECHTTPGEPL